MAARILFDFDAEPEDIRNEVISALAGPREKRDDPRNERQVVELLEEIRDLLRQLVAKQTADPRDWPPDA